MGNQPVLRLFLKALVAAKKSLGLYPAGSEMATTWILRLHRSLDEFFQQGLGFPVRVGRDRFLWPGEDLLTIDPALDALRFDLETRGIAELTIDPAVADWELQAFVELLNQPPASLPGVAGGSAYLRAKSVVHISVTPPGPGTALTDPNERAGASGTDALDLFIEAVLDMTDERLADLTYDRTALSGWFQAVTDGDRVDRLYSAVQTLGTMAEGSGDREVRTRTILEALLRLPESTLGPFLTKWLLPRAGSDLVAFNILTQVTDNELAEVAGLVPQEQLLAFTSELLEFPWEEGKRQRLLEAIAGAVRRQAEPRPPMASPAALPRDDAMLAELRREIIAACHPDALLDRSADVFLALLFNVESDEYPGFAVDAVEEIVGEALARDKVDLAIRILSSVGASTQLGHERMREHARRVALFRRRAAGRAQISLVVGLLQQKADVEQVTLSAEYLRLVTREGTEEFLALLADQRDRRVRARMCQVLAKVGTSIIPVLLPVLEDPRWYVVRNVLYVLGKLGHESAFTSVVAVLDHPDPRVRAEAIRAAGRVGGDLALGPLLRCARDPDSTVRRAVVRVFGTLRNDAAVPALRELVMGGSAAQDDLELKRDAVEALAAIGSPLARQTLSELAGQRVWLWARRDRRLRAMAMAALGVRPGESDEDQRDDDGR